MQLKRDDIEKIADLARLAVTDDTADKLANSLTKIFTLVDQLNVEGIDDIEPLSNPLDLTQPLRDDVVSEMNQRQKFQALAPRTHAGLYIVPQVIDSE